jgi:hypothetical protein
MPVPPRRSAARSATRAKLAAIPASRATRPVAWALDARATVENEVLSRIRSAVSHTPLMVATLACGASETRRCRMAAAFEQDPLIREVRLNRCEHVADREQRERLHREELARQQPPPHSMDRSPASTPEARSPRQYSVQLRKLIELIAGVKSARIRSTHAPVREIGGSPSLPALAGHEPVGLDADERHRRRPQSTHFAREPALLFGNPRARAPRVMRIRACEPREV